MHSALCHSLSPLPPCALISRLWAICQTRCNCHCCVSVFATYWYVIYDSNEVTSCSVLPVLRRGGVQSDGSLYPFFFFSCLLRNTFEKVQSNSSLVTSKLVQLALSRRVQKVRFTEHTKHGGFLPCIGQNKQLGS